MRVFSDFNDLKCAVGTETGISDWLEISQERINKFADATGDEQWIHVDPERAAREMPDGKTIAHGLLSLSLIPMFMRQVIGLKGLRNTLNYGANKIRYLTPVPAGSRLRGRISAQSCQRRAVRDLPGPGVGSEGMPSFGRRRGGRCCRRSPGHRPWL